MGASSGASFSSRQPHIPARPLSTPIGPPRNLCGCHAPRTWRLIGKNYLSINTHMIQTHGDKHAMAAPKRQKPTKRVEIGLETDVYEAIEDLLKRRPNLGNNPTDFLRRLIVAALQKHQPLKKG